MRTQLFHPPTKMSDAVDTQGRIFLASDKGVGRKKWTTRTELLMDADRRHLIARTNTALNLDLPTPEKVLDAKV